MVDVCFHIWDWIDDGDYIAVCAGCGLKLAYPSIPEWLVAKLKAVRRDGDG